MGTGSLVVVGAGMAGGRATDVLLKRGSEPVLLLGAETYAPYNRPELSKGLLLEPRDPDSIGLHPAGHYEALEFGRYRGGARVESLDPDRRELILVGGETIPYSRLLIATGGRPRRLDVPGADLDGIHYLRTIDDAVAIRAGLPNQSRVLVVGAGLVGLEVAAAVRTHGIEVEVVEVAAELFPALGPDLGPALRRFHEDRGVRFRFGVGVRRFEGARRLERVVLDDADSVATGLAVVGIGVAPDTGWLPAQLRNAAGAIETNPLGETAVAGIYAAGDVCRWEHPFYGPLTTEHESVAQNQGMHVAHTMLGRDRPFDRIPFAWSEQFGHSLRSVGVASVHRADDLVTLGSGGGMITLFLRDGGVLGGAGLDANAAVSRLLKALQGALPLPMTSALAAELTEAGSGGGS